MTIASRNYYASEIYETVPKLHCKVGNFTHIINTKTVTRNNAKMTIYFALADPTVVTTIVLSLPCALWSVDKFRFFSKLRQYFRNMMTVTKLNTIQIYINNYIVH